MLKRNTAFFVALVLFTFFSTTVTLPSEAGTGCSGNCQNGVGGYQFPNGDRYQGYWLNGLHSGKGTYTWSDGSTFYGDWNNGKMGKGNYRTVYRAPASVATSNPVTAPKPVGDYCVGDCENGIGTYTWTSGTVYSGSWKNGKHSGLGTLTYHTSQGNT